MAATFNFDGKRILVTGAGKGLGRALTKKLHECGASVVALSRTQADLDSLKKDLPGLVTVLCDVADWQKTRKAIESVLPIHHLVNNAAVPSVSNFLDITEEDLNKVFGININSIVNISQVVAKDMINRKEGGSIVNLSSIASRIHIEGNAPYNATKAALNMITKSMAFELAPHKIRVNALLPTAFPSQLSATMVQDLAYGKSFVSRHPVGGLPDENHMVSAILFLLSDLSTMMIGSEVVVDGGLLTH